MPIYEYFCQTCGHSFEVSHKMADPSPAKGPDCGKDTCHLVRKIPRVFSQVKSKNPFVNETLPLPDSFSMPESPTSEHHCGSGCAAHSNKF